jgi:hypothetical protein
MQKINLILFANQILKDEKTPKAHVKIQEKPCILYLLESCLGFLEEYKIQLFIIVPQLSLEFIKDMIDEWCVFVEKQNHFDIFFLPTLRVDYDVCLLSNLLKLYLKQFWSDGLCMFLSLNFPCVQYSTLKSILENYNQYPLCLIKKIDKSMVLSNTVCMKKHWKNNENHFAFTNQRTNYEYMFISLVDFTTFELLFGIKYPIGGPFYSCFISNVFKLPSYTVFPEGHELFTKVHQLQIENKFLRKEIIRLSRYFQTIQDQENTWEIL